jgi:hypothetical protein
VRVVSCAAACANGPDCRKSCRTSARPALEQARQQRQRPPYGQYLIFSSNECRQTSACDQVVFPITLLQIANFGIESGHRHVSPGQRHHAVGAGPAARYRRIAGCSYGPFKQRHPFRGLQPLPGTLGGGTQAIATSGSQGEGAEGARTSACAFRRGQAAWGCRLGLGIPPINPTHSFRISAGVWALKVALCPSLNF